MRSEAAKKNTQHQATKHTKTKKNRFNLSLCPLWFLGVRRKANPPAGVSFVFEDFFLPKNKDLTCNIIYKDRTS
jgi:hypothetical protein